MKPEQLLEALIDYGIFCRIGEDDYGRGLWALGEEDIGGLNGIEYENKWNELNEAELISELKQFLAIRKL